MTDGIGALSLMPGCVHTAELRTENGKASQPANSKSMMLLKQVQEEITGSCILLWPILNMLHRTVL